MTKSYFIEDEIYTITERENDYRVFGPGAHHSFETEDEAYDYISGLTGISRDDLSEYEGV